MRSFRIEHDGRPVLAYDFILVTSWLCWLLLDLGREEKACLGVSVHFVPTSTLAHCSRLPLLSQSLWKGFSCYVIPYFFCNVK